MTDEDTEDGSTEMRDALKPIYRLRWDDGTERRTDDIVAETTYTQVETLALLGRRDDSCTVEQVGYES